MRLKGVLCVPLGHKYHPARTDTPYPVIECERCGYVVEITPESVGGEGWMAREARRAMMGQMMDTNPPHPRR